MGWTLRLVAMLLLPAAGAASLPATVRLAVGENKPPYTFSNPPGGIEYDLLTAVIERMGCQADISMVPNARARLLFDKGQIDGTKAVAGEVLSQPYIAYQNVAVTLTDKKLDIRTIEDLAKYRVVAFQDAHLFLGPRFSAMAAANRDYLEASPQTMENRLLFSDRVDVAVSDVHIFDWLNRQVVGADATQKVTVHRIFAPTRYRIVFHDPELRDAFDKALREILASDLLASLAKKYLPNPLGSDFRP